MAVKELNAIIPARGGAGGGGGGDGGLLARHTGALEALQREVDVLARLQRANGPHQNLVRLIGCCFKPPAIFYVLEFVSGGSLDDALHMGMGSAARLLHVVPAGLAPAASDAAGAPGGPRDLPELRRARLAIARQVCTAMAFLHEHGVVHRDLKPANILLSLSAGAPPAAGRITAKVADFGLALTRRVASCEGDDDHAHEATPLAGSWPYLCPECFRGEPPTAQMDVYAFGILLYTLCDPRSPGERQRPWDHLPEHRICIEVAVNRRRPPLACVEPLLGAHRSPTADAVRTLIQQCWADDQGSRPSFVAIGNVLDVDDEDIIGAAAGEGGGGSEMTAGGGVKL